MLPIPVLIDLLLSLQILSDKELQCHLWGNHGIHVSSYEDEYNCLVDEFCTEEMVKEPAEFYCLTLDWQKEMALLLYMLASFEDTHREKTDMIGNLEIISLSGWDEVVAQAKVVYEGIKETKLIRLIEDTDLWE
jgi:hypothetical protein